MADQAALADRAKAESEEEASIAATEKAIGDENAAAQERSAAENDLSKAQAVLDILLHDGAAE